MSLSLTKLPSLCSAGCLVLVSSPASSGGSELVIHAAAEKTRSNHLKTADTNLDLLAVHFLQHSATMTEAKVGRLSRPAQSMPRSKKTRVHLPRR